MKQVILVRTDLNMGPGKTAAQCAHASVESVHKSSKSTISDWKSQGSKKVVLKVGDLGELLDYEKKAHKIGLKTALITDAGRTVFTEPTITCLAIGPDSEEKIDKMIESKKELAENIIGSTGENWITDLSNSDLEKLFKLEEIPGEL